MKAFQNEEKKHFPWQGNYLNCAYILAIMHSLTLSVYPYVYPFEHETHVTLYTV
jgi:hypothetical protein